ncbi:MAG: histidine--tRNA ligase [Bacteroidia bacterium]
MLNFVISRNFAPQFIKPGEKEHFSFSPIPFPSKNMAKPSIPRGTRDFAPDVMLKREWLFSTIKTVFRKYGYQPLETPAMENLSVLTGKYGEEGDRLIFKILNNGDYLKDIPAEQLTDAKNAGESGAKSLVAKLADRALRYDLTVPFARFVVMNHAQLTYPFKRYQIQPVWRADNPQANRYREFYQCDADVVGSESLIYDAEFVCIYDEALTNLGISDFTIQVNNRKILSGLAEVCEETAKFTEICVAIDKWDKIGAEGVKKELLTHEIAEDKIEILFEILAFDGSNLEKLDFLTNKFQNCPDGLKGIEELRKVFDLLQHFTLQKANVTFDLRLARGLNYYTGTIYEVRASSMNVSIGGGGRYDNLTGVFGVKGLSGIGISFGADRIYNVIEALDAFPKNIQSGVKVLIINFGDETLAYCLQTLQKLRNEGIAAELYPQKAKIGKQFEYADRKNIPFTLALGTEEMQAGVYKFKNMATGEQVSLRDIAFFEVYKKEGWEWEEIVEFAKVSQDYKNQL